MKRGEGTKGQQLPGRARHYFSDGKWTRGTCDNIRALFSGTRIRYNIRLVLSCTGRPPPTSPALPSVGPEPRTKPCVNTFCLENSAEVSTLHARLSPETRC